jgi:hypothetical protein
MLRDACSSLLDTAAGGSILISDVEEMRRRFSGYWWTCSPSLNSRELHRAPSVS